MTNLTACLATAAALATGGGALSVARKPARHVTGNALAADNGPACTSTLMVQPPRLRSSCVIDERVTSQPGTLTYSCNGNGVATADFGASRFQGTVQGGSVDLTLITQFTFSDHCNWQSLQHIRGTLAGGQLTYTYEEAPIPGQRGCAPACTTSTSVTVR